MLDRAMLFDRRRSIVVMALAVFATLLPIRFEKGAQALTSDNMGSATRIGTSSGSTVTISTDDSDEDVSASYFWDDGVDDDKSIYLFDGKDVRVMGSFNQMEHDHVLALREDDKVQIIERDGSSVVVIDDPKILKQAQEMFRALEPLEKKQHEFGLMQSQLGVKQSKLGRKQSELGLEMAKLGERMAELQVELMQRMRDGLDTSDVEAEMEMLGRQMEKLGQAQGALGEQQSQIGEEQSKIGERQSKIGEEQSRLSQEVREKLEKLIDRAKDEGLARTIE